MPARWVFDEALGGVLLKCAYQVTYSPSWLDATTRGGPHGTPREGALSLDERLERVAARAAEIADRLGVERETPERARPQLRLIDGGAGGETSTSRRREMASLQARHSRGCELGKPWTTFDAAKRGCTCTPMYHVVHRHDGKLVREPVGHNRKEAERALDIERGKIAKREYRIVEDIAFDKWADEWLAGFTGKENSRRVYATTIAYAKAVFGRRKVRDLGPGDMRRFLDHVREAHAGRPRRAKDAPPRQVSPATLAKHLRQLGACLEAAASEGYASDNPVKRLHKTARPKVAKSRPAYYTDNELARLWPELVTRGREPDEPSVFLYLCKAAVVTGMRIGELAALDWTDVDVLDRELQVRRQWTEGIGVVDLPKSNDQRTIDLTPQAAAVFEEWLKLAGDEGLVFERPEGGHLSDDYVRKGALYPALAAAGIPRVGESGRKRDFHSFRHTFARIALENGAEITWVKEQLGHSSITLTVDLYGHWSRASKKAQAEKLGAAFPV
jgi:integrase